jgi:hypothetical protein
MRCIPFHIHPYVCRRSGTVPPEVNFVVPATSRFPGSLVSICSVLRSSASPSADCRSGSSSVDLVAEHPNRTLAVQIHRARPGKLSTDWRAASELLLATGALGGLARDNNVEPLMVLVDSTADNSLQRLADDRSIKLVEVRRGSGALLGQLRGQLGFLRAAGTGAGVPGS